ncbi:MAG: hypothetical protein ACFCU7_13105 [Pleurocapsa sp.]
MYRAKSLGKARHEVFHQEMYAETKRLLETENDLHQAILQDQNERESAELLIKP